MRVIHFAPEPFLSQRIRGLFDAYFTADLARWGVSVKADLTRLPFRTGEFDLVYASHVLEHIPDDAAALREIRRILKKGGMAILPVPFYGLDRTVEYPRPLEFGHVRAPGLDYYERYRKIFSSVEPYTSDDFPGEHQVHVYEDWSIFPTEKEPLRPPVPGSKHIDIVPVCQA